jgi:ribose transport system substrate-binding protein
MWFFVTKESAHSAHDSQGRTARMKPRKRAMFAVAGVVALLAVACGSSGTKSTTSGGTTTTAASSGAAGGDVAAAQANATKYAAVPTQIVPTVPLSAKPAKKKVGFVVCSSPSCVPLAGFLKEATASLGWSLTTVNASATDPGAAVQQLIDSGVDYVAETGSDMKQIQTQASELKDKHIPLFECYATDVPAGPSNNLYSDCYDSSAAKVYGAALSDWVIADSGGKAHTLVVSLPAFPILTAQVDAVHAEFSKSCPQCKTSDLAASVGDLTSGAVAQNIASYLQTHTDINYVYESFAGLDGGVAKALQSAGLGKVKIVGSQEGAAQLQEIIAGTEAAWTALPQEYAMWTMADQMARLATNQWSTADERKSAVPPFYIISTPDQAKAIVSFKDGWPGPAGFKDAFKKLWGV